MRYLNIVLIIFIMSVLPLTLCGCTNSSKCSKISITHKSRLPQSVKRTANNVIDLSDGRRVNFSGAVGPSDISTPGFDIVTVDKN